jgi:DNA-binding CsgD family transcriptional regulator
MLSPREREVLRLLADGLVNSQISRGLLISESTTKTHVANLYEKLGAGNRTQAVLAGRRLGLIGDDDGGALVPATPQPKPPTLPPRGVALTPPLPAPVDGEDDWPRAAADRFRPSAPRQPSGRDHGLG